MKRHKTDLTIDKTNLDKEWMRQADLFFQWAETLADVRKKLDAVKSESDVIKAELAREIRKNPKRYGVPEGVKPTEKMISEIVDTDDEVISILSDVRDARHLVDMTAAMVDALDHKKRALENLVRLHGQQYFAAPHPGDAGSDVAADIKSDVAQERIRRRTQRRRRDD